MSETNNIELQVQGGEQPEIRLKVNGLNSKADKVDGATAGNFAGLDETGNLTDSGYKAADFATAEEIGTVPSGQTVEGQITALSANLTQLDSEKADMIVVSDSVEAAVKSFSDGGNDYPMQLVVGIEPVQDLHGLDAPYPPGGGVNKFETTGTTKTENGVTWKVNDDGSVTVSGTATGYTAFSIGQADVSGMSGNITLGFNVSELTNVMWGGCAIYDDSDNLVYRITDGSSYASFTVNIDDYPTAKWLKVGLKRNNNVATSGTIKVQVVAGGSMQEWVPYSNICPISGWTGVEVTRTGFNVWDEETELGYLNASGGNAASNNCIRTKNYISVIPGESYYIKTPQILTACRYKKDKTFISRDGITANTVYTIPSDTFYLRFFLPDAYGTTYNNDISINYPSTDIDYHAYAGTVYPITFPTPPGTVYGGTLSVNKDGTGVLTVDHGIINDLSDIQWTQYATNDNIFTATTTGVKVNSELLCSEYKSLSAIGINGLIASTEDVVICMRMDRENNLLIKNTNYATSGATALQNSLDGVQLVYELATKGEYDLTAEQVGQIKSLLGVNNVWANTGNVKAMEYSADTKLYIDNKLAAMLASLQ